MDAKVGDWVVTPRDGKPVEINALWHSALRSMAEWGACLKDSAAEHYTRMADQVRASFRSKFWNASQNDLYDLLTDHGPVNILRPNQIFAVSLPHVLLDREHHLRMLGGKVHAGSGRASLKDHGVALRRARGV